jgi:hypothetical protein
VNIRYPIIWTATTGTRAALSVRVVCSGFCSNGRARVLMNDLQYLNVRDIAVLVLWLLYDVASSIEVKKPHVNYDKMTENE